MNMPVVAILGSGSFAASLTWRFARAGLQVICGLPTQGATAFAQMLQAGLQNLTSASPEDAAKRCDVVVLTEKCMDLDAMAPFLATRTLVDSCEEPIALDELCRMGLYDNVIRSFRYQAGPVYEGAAFCELRPDLFYCGSLESQSESHLRQLAHAIDMRPVRIGGLDQSDLLEALGRLLSTLSLTSGRERLALRLLP